MGPGNMTLAVCSVVDRSSHSGARPAIGCWGQFWGGFCKSGQK